MEREPSPSRGDPRGGAPIRGLGPVTATALVAGNVIGSGIYVVPASLAEVAGPVSLLAWVVVGIGYLALTSIYGSLASAYPVSGGLQVYAQRAFGDLAGLVTAFVYWGSIVTGNAAFLTAFVGYCEVFFPALASPAMAFLVAQALLWSLTLVNALGVRAGGIVQTATTVLKILPLLVLAVALLAAGSPAHLRPFAPHGLAAIFPAISLVAWMFVGAESVTVPVEEVRGSGATVRRAAYAGYGIAAGVYLLVAAAMSVGLPASEIAGSASPLAVAGRRALGAWGEGLVGVGALVSAAGILNGWILVGGRLPFAASRQGLAPAAFGRLHVRFGTPIPGLALTSALTGILVLLYFSRTLLAAYNFIALASTALSLVAIGTVAAAHGVLLGREPERFTETQRRRGRALSWLGVAMAVLMIAGAGREVVLLTLLAAALPLPYGLWLRRRRATRRVVGSIP